MVTVINGKKIHEKINFWSSFKTIQIFSLIFYNGVVCSVLIYGAGDPSFNTVMGERSQCPHHI